MISQFLTGIHVCVYLIRYFNGYTIDFFKLHDFVDRQSAALVFHVMKSIATPNQIRAARVLLEMSQLELARKAGINVGTLSIIERINDPKNAVSRDKVQQTLEETLGIEFLPESDKSGDGLRFALPSAMRPVRPKTAKEGGARKKKARAVSDGSK